MPSITGTFSGRITKQSAMPLGDRPGHELGIGEVSGTQRSPDPLWDDSRITYWGVTDLLGEEGTQRGYYHNAHPDGGREWGTFEGRVSAAGGAVNVEGTWEIAGDDRGEN